MPVALLTGWGFVKSRDLFHAHVPVDRELQGRVVLFTRPPPRAEEGEEMGAAAGEHRPTRRREGRREEL